MWKSTRVLIPLCAAVLLTSCDADVLAPNRSLSRNELAARVTATPPLQTGSIGTQRITLWWTDNSKSETGWEVQRSTGGASGSFIVVASLAANTTQYDDTGLTPATNYCYRVRSFKRNGSRTTYDAFSSTACATTLGPPVMTAVPRTSTIVDLAWTPVFAAGEYARVEIAPSPAGPWGSLVILYPNATAYVHSSAGPEQQSCYRFVVVLVNQLGEAATTVDCTTPPRGVSNMAANSLDGQTIAVTWTDASSVEDGYEVQRAEGASQFVTIANLGANAASYQDGAVAPQTVYRYRVRAKKDGGFSDFSAEVAAALPSTPPVAPTGLIASPGGSTVALVSWPTQPATVGGIRVQRSNDGQVSWVDVGSIGGDQDGFTDPGREPEQQVCYRIFAFNMLGESGPSNVDCTAPPLNPINMRVDAYPNDGVLVLTFTARSNTGLHLITTNWCSSVCGIPREFLVGTDLGENTVVIYMETGLEFVESVCAYSDGGCSDPGVWGDGGTTGIAAIQPASLSIGRAGAARAPKRIDIRSPRN